MGFSKNRNQFSSLEILNDSDNECDESSDEIEEKIEGYQNFIKEQYEILRKEIDSNEHLTKNIWKRFLSSMNRVYTLINEIIVLMKRNDVENSSKKIYDLDQKLNKFYQLIDKYEETICSVEGFRRLNHENFLEEVDLYFNLFIVNKDVSYILCALENSSMDMLNVVDYIFFKEDRINKRKRYETYLCVLHENVELIGDEDMDRLREICKRDNLIEKYFDKLFRE
jgi:hypothetical protein